MLYCSNFGTLGDERIYSVTEVATILEVDQGHVYDLIKAGRLRASNIGTGSKPLYRIRKSAIVAFLDNMEAKPEPKRDFVVESPTRARRKARPLASSGTKAEALSPFAVFRAKQKGKG
jgi:excisionase family DNA binding protein